MPRHVNSRLNRLWITLLHSIGGMITYICYQIDNTHMTSTNLYRDLAKIQAQRKELEAKEAQLKIAIIEGMEAAEETSVDTKYGKATISTRTTYEYSDKVKALAEKVKVEQVKEQQKGIAKANQIKYLRFTPNVK